MTFPIRSAARTSTVVLFEAANAHARACGAHVVTVAYFHFDEFASFPFWRWVRAWL